MFKKNEITGKIATVLLVAFLSLQLNAQKTTFDKVLIEQWVGTGINEAIMVIDFDYDSLGTDSAFAWGIHFDADSISGDSILEMIHLANTNFTYDVNSGFLNNITYVKGTTYTNPNTCWFSVLESSDGTNWNWNNGIEDFIKNQEWFGIVVMDTATYQANINVPLKPVNIFCHEQNTFNFYPNPAKDFICLDIDINQNYKLQIIDSKGAVVLNEKILSNKVLLPNLHTGIYYVILKNNKSIKTSKLVIK